MWGKSKSRILVVIFMILGPLMCFWAPNAFLNISEYDFVVEEFNAAPTLTNSIDLPFSEVVHGTDAPVRLQGNLSIDRSVPSLRLLVSVKPFAMY